MIRVSCIITFFKVTVTDKTYWKPLFSSNKSLKKLIILLFVKNEESSKLVLSITSTSKLPAYLLKGYLLVILTVSKSGQILLNIWYLVNLLDLLELFGKNGSSFDTWIWLYFLENNGNSDNFFFLFLNLLFLHYKMVEFLINLHFLYSNAFYISSVFYFILQIENYFEILKKE